MKTKNLFLVPVLIAALNLSLAGRLTAQNFTILHSFTAGDRYEIGDGILVGLANSDGLYPRSLILLGNTLYGTAGLGGWFASGALFSMNTDGTGFTNLYSFAVRDLHGNYTPETNPDGINPNSLILSGNTLYGTAEIGGQEFDSGTLFAVNTDGTGFTNLHNFTERYSLFGITNRDGYSPEGRMVLSGNTLYGAAAAGGSFFGGTVFALNTNSTGFTVLHSFKGGSDGAGPYAGLVLSGNTLYGTANSGGSGNSGTVFALGINGTGLTSLHQFTATHTNSSGAFTNSEGANPRAGLLLSGNTLYGTASSGGSGGVGTVFAVNTNGTGFRILHNFTATHTNSSGVFTNNDGAGPRTCLVLSGNTLYGTAGSGGSSGSGTVFAVNTDGTGFTNLHNFKASLYPYYTNSDGANPNSLVVSGNALYGTAERGGNAGNGTVFSLSFAPRLTITSSGVPPGGIVLSWPTNVVGFDYTGYTLQSSTGLGSANWTNCMNATISGASFVVTNPISAGAQFFRLRK